MQVAANSAQARRNILQFEVDRVVEVGGLPWVRLVVVGQSFMMHQIRKMVRAPAWYCRHCRYCWCCRCRFCWYFWHQAGWRRCNRYCWWLFCW